jgi:hypothetical protein
MFELGLHILVKEVVDALVDLILLCGAKALRPPREAVRRSLIDNALRMDIWAESVSVLQHVCRLVYVHKLKNAIYGKLTHI